MKHWVYTISLQNLIKNKLCFRVSLLSCVSDAVIQSNLMFMWTQQIWENRFFCIDTDGAGSPWSLEHRSEKPSLCSGRWGEDGQSKSFPWGMTAPFMSCCWGDRVPIASSKLSPVLEGRFLWVEVISVPCPRLFSIKGSENKFYMMKHWQGQGKFKLKLELQSTCSPQDTFPFPSLGQVTQLCKLS